MPLWVAIGADSTTGEQTIDCVCASKADLARDKVNKLGHLVSDIYLVDNDKSRLGKYSVGICANWLKENGHVNLALKLLEQNDSVPDSFTFSDARWIVPFFIAASKTDRAWAAIQEAKIRGFTGSMYCEEAEQLHLIELEQLVFLQDGRTSQATYADAAKNLARSFLTGIPDKCEFIDIKASLIADQTGLDEDKLRLAADEIYMMCASKGALTAICSAVSIVESKFSE